MIRRSTVVLRFGYGPRRDRQAAGTYQDDHRTIRLVVIQMLKPPWDREWLSVTPTAFEQVVVDHLRRSGRRLKAFRVNHQSSIATSDGAFDLDASAVFEALGAEFLVLVECKHHKNPIKREVVQVLESKLRSTHAQKAMLFSTAPFQKGAVQFAKVHRIALVHITEGGPIWETRGKDTGMGPRRPYDLYLVEVDEQGKLVYRGPNAPIPL